MTDIVERLHNQILSGSTGGRIEVVAIEEIERLRARVSELELAIEKEYMDDAKELAESAVTKAPQEQAFNLWGESKGSFGFDYLEVWNSACAWQREKIKQSLTIYDDTEDSDCVLSFYRYKELFDDNA